MDKHAITLTAICIILILVAGCTRVAPLLQNETMKTIPIPVTTPVDNQTCTGSTDCVRARCLYPTSRADPVSIDACNLPCTTTCESTLDYGTGTCGCTNGGCSENTSFQKILNLTVSPQRYSPLMSSTVGVGIEVDASGFNPADTLFTWNATYGYFLSWGPVDWTVKHRGNPVTNHGEKLYWSFIEKPDSRLEPVFVTVTATDPATGRVLGKSTLTLEWDGDYEIVVKNSL